MIKRTMPTLLVAALAAVGLSQTAEPAQRPQPQTSSLQWIWYDEGDPLTNAPAGTRYFRKTVDVGRAVEEAQLDITADDAFRVRINGVEVGAGDTWKTVYRFDVAKH